MCSVFYVLLALGAIVIKGHYIQSPCPNIFEYKSDESGIYGVIHLRYTGPVASIIIRANFTIATRLMSNYLGRLAPIGNNLHFLQDYNRGVPIDYRVDFPTTSPLPRLTAVVVNDNVICYGPGDTPSPIRYVTLASLQHKLSLKAHQLPSFQGNGFYNQYEQSQMSKPEQQDDLSEFIAQIANDGETQIFTIGDDGKPHNVWNSNLMRLKMFDIVNYPNLEQPATRPPQRQPETQYVIEVVTQAPKPDSQYYLELVTEAPKRTPPPLEPTQQPSRPPPMQTFPTPARVPELVPESAVQCGVVSGGNEHQPLVFNGQGYSRGDWPWLVAIYKRKDGGLNFICSGTLVSDRHVVTAAHCVQQRNAQTSQRDIVVKIGVYNLEDWGDDITVTRSLASAHIHESFNASSLANDISVLILERTIEFNTNIRPVCLWNGNTDLSRIVGASGVVAGWGLSELGEAGRGEPRMVRIPVVSTAMCRASRPDFHKLTSSKTLCAGDRKGSGPCLGDSGGGLYLLEGGRWRLRGVVSLSLRPNNGDSTCNLNEYIVFTDSAQYLGWIQTVMSY